MKLSWNLPTTPAEHTLRLPCADGYLQALWWVPNEIKHDYIAVICHPHSLYGGTMHNKVVTTVARLCRDMGVPSLRFNMRGVEESAGSYDHGIGESEDVLWAMQVLRQQFPNKLVILAGFSFGSYVAYRAASQRPPALLITIAPAVENFDYQALPVPQCRWIVVMGEDDEVVSADKVFSWLKSLENPPELLRFANTGHFFHGKLMELKQRLASQMALSV